MKNMFGQEIDGDGNVVGWSGGVGGSWNAAPAAPAQAAAPSAPAQAPAPATGQADQYGITDDQYRTYFGRNNSQADINAAASYLGLNQGQLAALQNKYGYSGIITKQGANLTNDQLKGFYSSGADEAQAAQTLGLDNEAVQNARRIAGGIGIYTDPGQYEQYAIWADGQRKNQNLPNPYGTGGFDEWRAGQRPEDLARWKTGSFSPNSGVAYDPKGTGFGNGIIASGVPNVSGSAANRGTGSGSQTSTSSGGTSGPGNWQVTPEQTVESRVAGILAAGNPLVEQRRAQADMKMNSRGLVNSSIAQTASDDAAYSAALDIARPDAATFADAAKTNAMAKTTWGISQANNQTSRDNTTAQIGAQRELQRATQLYNNLANQTSTASNLQSWGLNTVTAIQASDLSAEAKSAAIQTIQQYLTDSYQIQGDWHTSAARMIDSIFD